jgi:hypothetical protein
MGQVRATFGFSFTHGSVVVRPGHQISRDLNPYPLRPQPTLWLGLCDPVSPPDTTDYCVIGNSPEPVNSDEWKPDKSD